MHSDHHDDSCIGCRRAPIYTLIRLFPEPELYTQGDSLAQFQEALFTLCPCRCAMHSLAIASPGWAKFSCSSAFPGALITNRDSPGPSSEDSDSGSWGGAWEFVFLTSSPGDFDNQASLANTAVCWHLPVSTLRSIHLPWDPVLLTPRFCLGI